MLSLHLQMVRALSTGGGDARSVLLAKRKRQMMAGGDARDRLGQMAKTTDARAKITKIRNIKQGKVGDVITPLYFYTFIYDRISFVPCSSM